MAKHSDQKPKKHKELTPAEILLQHEEFLQFQACQAAAKARGDDEADLYFEELLMELHAVPSVSQLQGLPPVTDPADERNFVTDQVNWVRRTGETPLEFLTRMYRHPFVDRKDRIAAARAVQDYVHQKLPTIAVLKSNSDGGHRHYTGIREKLAQRLSGLAKSLGASSDGPSPVRAAAKGPKR